MLLLLDARHRVLDRPVYLGKGGQGWSEPAAMTPTDERARERGDRVFGGKRVPLSPTSLPTPCLSYINI
jgi:hypothetical protein